MGSNKFLVYHRGSRWYQMAQGSIPKGIRELLPPGLHAAWDLLLSNSYFDRDEERVLLPLLLWMDEVGYTHGFRRPDVRERARNMGMEEYLEELASVVQPPMTHREMFNLQGNSFDPLAIALRIGPAVVEWLRGGSASSHRFPGPVAVDEAFEKATKFVKDQNKIPPNVSPYPSLSMHGRLSRGVYFVRPPPSVVASPVRLAPGTPLRAAESGRGNS